MNPSKLLLLLSAAAALAAFTGLLAFAVLVRRLSVGRFSGHKPVWGR